MAMAKKLSRQESVDLAARLGVDIEPAGPGKVRLIDHGSSTIVPSTIDAASLLAVVDHGRHCFQSGQAKGRADLKTELLSLIGARAADT